MSGVVIVSGVEVPATCPDWSGVEGPELVEGVDVEVPESGVEVELPVDVPPEVLPDPLLPDPVEPPEELLELLLSITTMVD